MIWWWVFFWFGPCPDLNHVLIWFCLAYRVQKVDTCLGVASNYTDINLWTTNPAGRICCSGCASIWHDHLSRDTIGDCLLFVEHVFVEHHIQTPGNQGTYVIVSSTCTCLKPICLMICHNISFGPALFWNHCWSCGEITSLGPNVFFFTILFI